MRIVASGQTGIVARLAPTEWGLLCDVLYDTLDGAAAQLQRVHSSTELAPL